MKTALRNGRRPTALPVVTVESCGNCQRWDRLPQAAQPADGAARGVCCGQPPAVFFTPTDADPKATLSTSPVTLESRPGCHLWKAKA